MIDPDRAVRGEDLLPVFSRVSWAALFAGLFVALTVFLVLSALGAAIGLSVADTARGEAIATGAGIWAIVTALVAFFTGGCVTSRCTAGESRTEAAIYGTILWGLTMTLLLWMGGAAIRTGFSAVVGTANVAANATNPPADWEAAARRAGLTEAQINQMRAELPSQARVQDASAAAAWWSLLGILVSLLAAVGGAVTGAGRGTPAFGGIAFRQTSVQVERTDGSGAARPGV
jgi:hypothetical protein